MNLELLKMAIERFQLAPMRDSESYAIKLACLVSSDSDEIIEALKLQQRINKHPHLLTMLELDEKIADLNAKIDAMENR